MASPLLILFHILKLTKGFKVTYVNCKYYINIGNHLYYYYFFKVGKESQVHPREQRLVLSC